MLFIIFVIVYPLSIDLSRGLVVNTLLPLVLYWAIRGFQILSKRLEDPMGNDETDLNLYEKLHSLEVSAEHAFDLSADAEGDVRRALQWTENWVTTGEDIAVPSRPARPRKEDKSFRCFFRWMPIPTLMMREMMDSHGDVEVLHALRLTFSHICCCTHGVRRILRRVLWRMEGDRLYQAVNQHPASATVGADEDKFFNSDPHFFCHYLQFLGSLKVDSGHPGLACKNPWPGHAVKLLGDEPAASLLTPMSEEDTERSMMMDARTCTVSSIWECLS
jgi:hypothetical protein